MSPAPAKEPKGPIKGPIRAANPGDDAIEVNRNHGKPTKASELAKALAAARKAGKPVKVVEPTPIAPAASKPIAAEDAILKLEHDLASKSMPKTKKQTTKPTEPTPAPMPAPAPSVTAPVLETPVAPKKPKQPAPEPEGERPVRVFADPKPAPQPPSDEGERPRRIFSDKPAPSPTKAKAAQLRFVGMKPMHVVEAALFAAGKPIAVEEIVETTGLPPESVKEGMKDLVKEYEGRDTILEVGKAGTKWGMQVKTQASEPAAKFAPMEIPAKTLKTLALIAFHQPLKQSVLVDMVGSKAYDHVHELHERGLVKAREEGPTKILYVTSLFPEYFGLDAATPEEIRATMAKLVGLDPSKLEKPAEAKVVYEETQPSGDAEAKPEGEAAEGAQAVTAPTPTTN